MRGGRRASATAGAYLQRDLRELHLRRHRGRRRPPPPSTVSSTCRSATAPCGSSSSDRPTPRATSSVHVPDAGVLVHRRPRVPRRPPDRVGGPGAAHWIEACDRMLALEPARSSSPATVPSATGRASRTSGATSSGSSPRARRGSKAACRPLDAARDLAGGPYAGWGESERLVVNLTALARDLGLAPADDVLTLFGGMAALAGLLDPPIVLTYEEAAAAVTAPGERFEIETIEVGGVPVKAFKHAPPSLRELFATARDRGRRHLPRLRGRALELRRGDGARRCHGRAAGRSLRHRARRSGGHRHAELPRVGHRVRGHHLDRCRVGVAQRVVDRRRARLRPRGLRRHGADRRRRARRAGPRDRRSPRLPRARGASAGRAARGRRPLGGPARPRGADARRRRHARPRRHDPLHVRHHRASQGGGVHPPRRRAGPDGLRLQGGAGPPAARRAVPRPSARAASRRPSSSSCRSST